MFFITTDIKGVKGKICVFYKISFSDEKFEKYLLELAYQKVTIHLEIKNQHFHLFSRNKGAKIIFSDSLLTKDQDCLEDYILSGTTFSFSEMEEALEFAKNVRKATISYLRKQEKKYKWKCRQINWSTYVKAKFML